MLKVMVKTLNGARGSCIARNYKRIFEAWSVKRANSGLRRREQEDRLSHCEIPKVARLKRYSSSKVVKCYGT